MSFSGRRPGKYPSVGSVNATWATFKATWTPNLLEESSMRARSVIVPCRMRPLQKSTPLWTLFGNIAS
uniref:Uncharacterized protein n=1 Tax=Hyaloperonospora arabidopsidis (strain Emoy2) TaxID=559515 RepID=M4B257_HYAAE